LKNAPGISYARIASTAHVAGKKELATMLLDYEPKPDSQVPLLISMNQPWRALDKAIASGNTDLAMLVILHLYREHKDSFFDTLARNKVALALYIQYTRQTDTGLLQEVYRYLGRKDLEGDLAFRQALTRTKAEESDKIWKNEYQKASSLYKSVDHFKQKMVDEKLSLLLDQRDLEAGGDKSEENRFVGSSLSSTIYRLILLGNNKRAGQLKDKYKVPSKRYWWIVIRALAASGNWPGLEKLAKDKSPIGYRPFAQICIDEGKNDEAVKYIPKISSAQERITLYASIGRWKEAVDDAINLKDPELLQQIAQQCNDPSVANKIQHILQSNSGR